MIHYSFSSTEPLQGLLNVIEFVICLSRERAKYPFASFKGMTRTASLLSKELFSYTSTQKAEHTGRDREEGANVQTLGRKEEVPLAYKENVTST